MKPISLLFLTLFLAGAALLAPVSGARAARVEGANLAQKYPVTVNVISYDGKHYAKISGNGPQLTMSLWGKCDAHEEIDQGSVTAEGWDGPPTSVNFSIAPHANSAPPTNAPIPDGILPNGFAWPSSWTKRAVDACNANLVKQVNQNGMTPAQVMAKSWELQDVFLTKVHGGLTCNLAPGIPGSGSGFDSSGDPSTSVNAKMNVVCQRHLENDFKAEPKGPPTASHDFKLKVGVNQATLLMLPKNYTGHCPVEVSASGTIVTNGVTTVKYRFESDKGELSPIHTVQVDQTHTAYVIAKFNLGMFKTNGSASSFTAPNAAPSDPPGFSGASKLQNAPAQPGVHQGFYRLHIVAPNQLVSAPASYKITCTVTTPGSMAQKPGAPALPPAPGAPLKLGVPPGGTQSIKRLAK